MIRECAMRAGKLYLGHMARYAVLFRHFADSFRCAGVACIAFCVVCGDRGFYSSMRIVARGAADAPVVGIETLAVRKAVRLKADIEYAARAVCRDLRPCAMAFSAEVRHPAGSQSRQLAQFWMRREISVAAVALNAGGLFCRVASEALRGFLWRGQSARGFEEVLRFYGLEAERKVEAIECGIVADAAFVPSAPALKKIGLAGCAFSEGPGEGEA